MNKQFDTGRRDRLHSEARHRLLPPDRTLDVLGLRPGDRMVDIGCGTGFFAIPAARIVGPEGRVTGIDPSGDMLEALKHRAREAGITVHAGSGHAGRIPLADASATFALMANVLHELDNPQPALREALRVLVPGGRIAIVEWRVDFAGGGPPPRHRLSLEKIRSLLLESGFSAPHACDAGRAHTAMTALRGA